MIKLNDADRNSDALDCYAANDIEPQFDPPWEFPKAADRTREAAAYARFHHRIGYEKGIKDAAHASTLSLVIVSVVIIAIVLSAFVGGYWYGTVRGRNS